MLKYFDIHRNGKRNTIHNLNQVRSSNWYVFNIKMLGKSITEPMFFHEFSSFADAYDFFLNKMELFKNFKSEEIGASLFQKAFQGWTCLRQCPRLL